MTRPHQALLAVASGRTAGHVADEAVFLASAHEHRMVGATLRAAEQGRLSLSPAVLTTLGVWDLAERREHLRFWRTIGDAQVALAPAGIEVAVLKGVATEARWYDEPGERVTTDVDLLVDPAALPRVSEVIARLDPGYGPRAAADWLVRRRLLQHVDLRMGDTQVDLHFDPFKVGVPMRRLHEVWATTEVLEAPHGKVRCLAPEVELVLLLLHLNKDGFALLGPFLDIGRIVERAALDWDRLAALVDAEGLQVPVWCSLAKVAGTLGIEVPGRSVSGARVRTWNRLWGPGRGLDGDAGRASAPGRQRLLPLHVRGRPVDVAVHLRRQLLPPRQLLEVAGRLGADDSYVDHVLAAVRSRAGGLTERDRRRAGDGAGTVSGAVPTGPGGDGGRSL